MNERRKKCPDTDLRLEDKKVNQNKTSANVF